MIPLLNLLSPEDKKKISRRKLLLLLHEILLLFFILTAIGSSVLLAARLILEQKFYEVNAADTPSSPKIAILNRDIRNINKALVNYNHIASRSVNITPFITELIKQTPLQIQWEQFSLREDNNVNLRGIALSRDGLIQFKQNLENLPFVKNINLPLQYLVSGDKDIKFAVDFMLRIHEYPY